jgi:hypothetical protein
LARDARVAATVAGKLGAPVSPVGPGNVSAFGASVPKTTVDEKGDPVISKMKVRSAQNSIIMQRPAANSVLV